ncbi:MAG: ABC transporter ATP-binding protein [Planctomycetes bacterium]|nr:ABC transporter ATP-binding protein [Planctomycetota bacterium]
MSEPVIVFDKVSKYYPMYHHITGGIKQFIFHLPSAIKSFRSTRFQALQELSFSIQPGERLGIIGRNGSGKSTTLGLLARVLKPSSGRITLRGRVSPFLELGMGFHAELTGRENILLNGIILGMTRKEVRKRMDAIIEFAEIGEFIEQPIRMYSSGMLARLGFSVVAHLNPEILLIDEILAVGDAVFQKKCQDKMLSFRQKNVTIVFVSHAMSDVRTLCNRVILLDRGKPLITGAPDAVIKAYEGLPA